MTAVKLTHTLPTNMGTIPKELDAGFQIVPNNSLKSPLTITGAIKYERKPRMVNTMKHEKMAQMNSAIFTAS